MQQRLTSIPARASLYSPPPNTREMAREKRQSRLLLWYVGIGMCLFVGMLFIWNMVIAPWWQSIHDQWEYGTAKVSVLDADVGHGGVSHFAAFDSQGEIIVIEVVGKPAKYIVYPVAAVIGADKQRIVSLQIVDVNHDGKPDLVIQVEGMSATFVLFNTGSAFSWTSR